MKTTENAVVVTIGLDIAKNVFGRAPGHGVKRTA
jgi:hypothetical protein